MPITAFLNDIPKPAWIVAMILGFIFAWPLGLAILAYMFGSGRFGRGRCAAPGQWHNAPPQGTGGGWGKWGQWAQAGAQGFGGNATPPPPIPSGNAAFDEYRLATLRRLEDEQKEFVEYLERLRQAKDKAEFDQFMADRRAPTIVPDASRGV